MRGITQGCSFLGLKYLMWCWLLAGKRLEIIKINSYHFFEISSNNYNSFIVSFL